MMTKKKFLNSIIASAQSHDIAMPWTRGPARLASIARRRNAAETPVAKSA